MQSYEEGVASSDLKDYAWLRIIRDPYNRAVSSYRHLLRHGYEDARIENRLGISIGRQGLSFAEFLDFLRTIDLENCNRHHSEQWHPIETHIAPQKLINIDRSDLLIELRSFEAEIGQEPLAPQLESIMLQAWAQDSKRYHRRLEAGAGTHAATRFMRTDVTGPWPSYESFLDNDARRNIEVIYAKDFAAYGTFL